MRKKISMEQPKQLKNTVTCKKELIKLIYPERIALGLADVLTDFAISGAIDGVKI